MYIFLFWPFKIFGFILTIYILSIIGEQLNLKLTGSAIETILLSFSLPLVALFWINFNSIYLKLINTDKEKTKKKDEKKKR